MEVPMTMTRSVLEPSSKKMAWGSANAVAASGNEIPCASTLDAALASSHSKSPSTTVATPCWSMVCIPYLSSSETGAGAPSVGDRLNAVCQRHDDSWEPRPRARRSPPPSRGRNRIALAASLNTLLASPTFASWRQGATLDIDGWLTPKNGRTPAIIVSVAHLDDDERALVLGVLLEELLTSSTAPAWSMASKPPPTPTA